MQVCDPRSAITFAKTMVTPWKISDPLRSRLRINQIRAVQGKAIKKWNLKGIAYAQEFQLTFELITRADTTTLTVSYRQLLK